MAAVNFQIMKYYSKLFSSLKILNEDVTITMSCASIFSSYVTMVPHFFIAIINTFFTNPASVSWFKLLFFFFFFFFALVFFPFKFLFKFLLRYFFHYFFTIFVFLKNCFKKFISSIFTPKTTFGLLNLASIQTTL